MELNQNIKSLRELFKNLRDEKCIENESKLWKTAVFDSIFYIKVKNQDTNNTIDSLDTTRNEKGELLLVVYTDLDQIKEDINNYHFKNTLNFDSIVSIVNDFLIEKVCINPETDNLLLGRAELNDLMRQKKYNISHEPIKMRRHNDFAKPAYKAGELDFSNTKVTEIYKQYLENKNPDILNDFYNELVNNAKFLTPVSPEENASTDENGKKLISKNRVLQYNLKDGTASYLAYTTAASFINEMGNDMYASVLDFEDYIVLLDTYCNAKSINIIGDVELKIPINDLNELKVQKDRFKNNKPHAVVEQQYNNEPVEEKLKAYFSQTSEIEKVWLSLELDPIKGYNTINIYMAGIKEISHQMNDDLRKILENALYKISIVNPDTNNSSSKLIYEKNQ